MNRIYPTEDKGEFIKFLEEAVEAKNEYFKYKAALESVKNTGYGISTPVLDEMVLGMVAYKSKHRLSIFF